jgi:hypothetical protein
MTLPLTGTDAHTMGMAHEATLKQLQEAALANDATVTAEGEHRFLVRRADGARTVYQVTDDAQLAVVEQVDAAGATRDPGLKAATLTVEAACSAMGSKVPPKAPPVPADAIPAVATHGLHGISGKDEFKEKQQLADAEHGASHKHHSGK